MTTSKQMKPTKQPENQIIVFVTSTTQPQPPKKPKINPHLLKAISLMMITLISWLQPEAAIAIFLIKLFFIVIGWLNQKDKNSCKNILWYDKKFYFFIDRA